MLDHVSLGVCNIERSRRFYDAALRPLGLVRILDFRGGKGADYGAAPGSPGVEFTITEESGPIAPPRGSHLCFRAPDRAAVAAFHKRRSPPVAKTTESPGQEATIILIMRRLFLIQMGIASKPCAMLRRSRR